MCFFCTQWGDEGRKKKFFSFFLCIFFSFSYCWLFVSGVGMEKWKKKKNIYECDCMLREKRKYAHCGGFAFCLETKRARKESIIEAKKRPKNNLCVLIIISHSMLFGGTIVCLYWIQNTEYCCLCDCVGCENGEKKEKYFFGLFWVCVLFIKHKIWIFSFLPFRMYAGI